MRILSVCALALVAAITPVTAQYDREQYASAPGPRDLARDRENDDERDIGSGMASYYGSELAGNRTASGERFDPEDFTAAHPTMKFGSRVRVTNIATGLSTIVRVNDRGPWRGKRIIDISRAAARAIGLDRAGIGRVSLRLLRN